MSGQHDRFALRGRGVGLNAPPFQLPVQESGLDAQTQFLLFRQEVNNLVSKGRFNDALEELGLEKMGDDEKVANVKARINQALLDRQKNINSPSLSPVLDETPLTDARRMEIEERAVARPSSSSSTSSTSASAASSSASSSASSLAVDGIYNQVPLTVEEKIRILAEGTKAELQRLRYEMGYTSSPILPGSRPRSSSATVLPQAKHSTVYPSLLPQASNSTSVAHVAHVAHVAQPQQPQQPQSVVDQGLPAVVAEPQVPVFIVAVSQHNDDMHGLPSSAEALIRNREIAALERARAAFRRFQAHPLAERKEHLALQEEKDLAEAESELSRAAHGRDRNYETALDANRGADAKQQRQLRQHAFEVYFEKRAKYLKSVHEKVRKAVDDLKNGRIPGEDEDFSDPLIPSFPEAKEGKAGLASTFSARDNFLAFLRSVRQNQVNRFVAGLNGLTIPRYYYEVIHRLVGAVSPAAAAAMTNLKEAHEGVIAHVRVARDYLDQQLNQIQPDVVQGADGQPVPQAHDDTARNRIFNAAAEVYETKSRQSVRNLLSVLGSEAAGLSDAQIAALLRRAGVNEAHAPLVAQLLREETLAGAAGAVAGRVASNLQDRIQGIHREGDITEQKQPDMKQQGLQQAPQAPQQAPQAPQAPVAQPQPQQAPQAAQQPAQQPAQPAQQAPVAQPQPQPAQQAPQPAPQPQQQRQAGPALIPIDQKEEDEIDRGQKSTEDSRQWDYVWPGLSTLQSWCIAPGPQLDQKTAGVNAESNEFARQYNPSTESDNPFYWAQLEDDRQKGQLPKGGYQDVFSVNRFFHLSRFPLGSDFPIVGKPMTTVQEAKGFGIPEKAFQSTEGCDLFLGGLRYAGGAMPRNTADWDLQTNPFEPIESSVNFDVKKDMNFEFQLGLTNPSLGWLSTPEGKLLPNDNMTRVDKEIKETVVGLSIDAYEDRQNAYPYQASKPMNITKHVPRNYSEWYYTGELVHDRDGASEYFPGLGFRKEEPDPAEKIARSGPAGSNQRTGILAV